MTTFRQVQSSTKKYRFTLQNGMYFICEKALKIHKYPNLHQMVLETVQSLKNRIIFKIYGQFHYGIAHFQKEKDKLEFEGAVIYG